MEPAAGARMPPFTRLAYFFYNNAAQEFENIIIDTRFPGMMKETSRGNGDENGGNTITVYLEGFILPGWGKGVTGQWVKQRRVVRVESANRHVIQQSWTLPAGQEWMAVEYVYTRQK